MSASVALPMGVYCILAPNPSLLTGPGTNTYLVADEAAGEVVVIDPGPNIPEHLRHVADAVAALGKATAILVTHGHPDHADGAASLRELLGVPVYAWSREGVAATDQPLADGAVVAVGTRSLRALHTPGHRFDHLCFWRRYGGYRRWVCGSSCPPTGHSWTIRRRSSAITLPTARSANSRCWQG
jgi:glyoxylase-like metal-dependent hydrolase (beta-lactamase superfamily II)